MGERTLTLRRAWSIHDLWLRNSLVEFYPEPFAGKAASKWVGDCYLFAYAVQSHAALATFDKALYDFACKDGCPAIIPG